MDLGLGAGPSANTFVPVPEVFKVFFWLEAHQFAGKVDGGQRCDVCQRKALAGHIAAVFEFAVQAFVKQVRVFVAGLFGLGVLLETASGDLCDNGAVHPARTNLGPQLKLENAVVHFDLTQFDRCCAKQVGFGVERFEVAADGDAFADVLAIIGFEHGYFAAGVHAQKVGRFVFTATHINLLVLNVDSFLGDKNTNAAWVRGYGYVKKFQGFWWLRK